MATHTPVFDSLPPVGPAPRLLYAGVGSRKSPPEVLASMTRLAAWLRSRGYTLRSGAAAGADQAFEAGADDMKEIFPGGRPAGEREHAVARELHPNPHALDRSRHSRYVWNLMARNTNQVFGAGLDSPVDFVVCWTPDGAEHWSERTQATGGTGQAIEMASRKGIPVVNMARAGWRERIVGVCGANPATGGNTAAREP
jgi:hypothetical protein